MNRNPTEGARLAAYADPPNPALPKVDVDLDLRRTALVITDPQIDFLSPHGAAWSVFGESIAEHGTVGNIGRLFEASKRAGICVVISPHYYYPHDHRWDFAATGETLMHKLRMFDRRDPLSLEGFDGSGADWMPEYRAYIQDGRTIVCSPHKIAGPQTNDVVFQLRKRRVDQVILAGMAANFCVESHLRDFVEKGFEVAVVRDATAGSKLPEGDAYLAALINFRWFANALWTTDEAVDRLGPSRQAAAGRAA
jgi:biuret amidohydrolase